MLELKIHKHLAESVGIDRIMYLLKRGYLYIDKKRFKKVLSNLDCKLEIEPFIKVTVEEDIEKIILDLCSKRTDKIDQAANILLLSAYIHCDEL